MCLHANYHRSSINLASTYKCRLTVHFRTAATVGTAWLIHQTPHAVVAPIYKLWLNRCCFALVMLEPRSALRLPLLLDLCVCTFLIWLMALISPRAVCFCSCACVCNHGNSCRASQIIKLYLWWISILCVQVNSGSRMSPVCIWQYNGFRMF